MPRPATRTITGTTIMITMIMRIMVTVTTTMATPMITITVITTTTVITIMTMPGMIIMPTIMFTTSIARTTTITATAMLMTTNEPADAARLTEREAAALYRLMTWLSPAFPVGGFSYSSGIEWAVEAGDITDVATLADWLDAMLTDGAGFCDATFLVHAFRAAETGEDDRLHEVAELAAAFVPSRERQLETVSQGRAFIDIARAASRLLTSLPSESVTSSGATSASGEFGICFARCNSSARTASDVVTIPFATEAAIHDPPSTGDRGSAESPSLTVMASSGSPSISAATCAMIV